jgi:hypothetical protein
MMRYKVIAECVDTRSGKRYLPGPDTYFDPAPEADQAQRLIKAGVLREEPDEGAKHVFLALATDAAGAGFQLVDTAGFAFGGVYMGGTFPSGPEDFHWQPLTILADEIDGDVDHDDDDEDGLGDQTVPELRELAATEEVDLTGLTRKPDILAAIRAKRLDASAS